MGIARSAGSAAARWTPSATRSRPQSCPSRVRRDAFGPGLPRRDLFLSPDHALFVEDALIPVRYLIDGTTVRQMPARGPITYFNVELDRHDVLFAEGLPTESYLEAGQRAAFENGGVPMALHPDFATRVWEARGYAPLAVTGPSVDAARHLLRRSIEASDVTIHMVAA